MGCGGGLRGAFGRKKATPLLISPLELGPLLTFLLGLFFLGCIYLIIYFNHRNISPNLPFNFMMF